MSSIDRTHRRRNSRSGDGCQRRAVLQVGLAGFAGLSLPDLLAARALADAGHGSASGFGSAKRCIFLFMWGGPSHLDTFDMKPAAPLEIRGEFQSTATSVAGLRICEHFEQLASQMNHLAVLRSLNHDDPAHLSSGHTTLTGQLPPVNKSDAAPPSDRDTPPVGCVISHLRPATLTLPTYVALPWNVAHPAAPGGQAPGQHGGWLGRQHDPFLITGDPNQQNWCVPSLSLADGISTQRMQHRQSLLSRLDHARRDLDRLGAAQTTHWQRRAFELLASKQVRRAFDLSAESPQNRDRYGRHLHGQCVLLARRLIEHGVPMVTVNWHNDGRNFWDTHRHNFQRLKRDLIPPADRALAALLADLSERNLLQDTLVVWVGEFGRKPRISAAHAGREHWPFCYSGLLAGGGIRGGMVYGASDKHGARPAQSPVSPRDLIATVYRALGVPRRTTLLDTDNRPRPIYGGDPITEVFG